MGGKVQTVGTITEFINKEATLGRQPLSMSC